MNYRSMATMIYFQTDYVYVAYESISIKIETLLLCTMIKSLGVNKGETPGTRVVLCECTVLREDPFSLTRKSDQYNK